jgi:hypothetical protein
MPGTPMHTSPTKYLSVTLFSHADVKGYGASRTEVAAFVGMILSVVLFITYVAWAIVPDNLLISFGVSYFPNKYWAVALPLYFVMLGLFVVTGYIALSMYYNPELCDLRLAEDNFSKVRPLPRSPDILHFTEPCH